MIKYFSLLLFTIFSVAGYSQVTVTNNLTVQQYVENVLLGSGVTVSNILYNGIPAGLVQEGVGEFNDPTSATGLSSGFIMGSGNVQMAAQPNTGTGTSLGGSGAMGVDTDLQSITANQIWDECVIEFDFVPSGDTISFRYVFASEEYPEYVCGGVNDAFGFFLTGTNPNGPAYAAKNLALIPDPNNPNVFTNTPVSINTVNPGVSGMMGDPQNCTNADPAWAAYNIFYAPNDGVNDTLFEYDGGTVPLTAVAAVICGETYHIKLAIGDAGDNVFDSGVFLEANSFNSSGLSITANVVDTYEGCGNAMFIITRSDANSNGIVPLLIQGDATNGVDYELIPDSIVFAPGALSDTIYLNTYVNDDGTSLSEDVEILINNSDACGGPIITIMNVEPMVATINLGDTLCPEAPLNETHTFTATITGGVPLGYAYVWLATPSYDFGWQQGQPTITVAPGVTTVFQLAVGDICGNAVATIAEEVYVECLLSVPNVFTPNNDGSNDFFEIRNIEDYPNSELVILNRWGNVVYEVTGYKNDWKGDDVLEGVYFYKLYPNGRKYETGMYQGFFHIVK
jgi:gliding motility-associated-like protein